MKVVSTLRTEKSHKLCSQQKVASIVLLLSPQCLKILGTFVALWHRLFMQTSCFLVAFLCLSFFAGCSNPPAQGAQRELLSELVPRVSELLRADREKARRGIIEAARRLSRGFEFDESVRAERLRGGLGVLRDTRRGIEEFIVSPITFLAVTDQEGVVITRDGNAENDRMRGNNYAETYPPVQAALDGQIGYGVVDFGRDEAIPSVTVIHTAPIRYQGEVVGTVIAGMPFWRLAERLSLQMRTESSEEVLAGEAIWVSLYSRGQLFYSPGAPLEIVASVPTAETRDAGLSRSPSGFTIAHDFYGADYGIAVIPLLNLSHVEDGENTMDGGFIIYRSEPQNRTGE